ncbi:tRNA pseudouridine(38-40) synthase TruA [Agaribacterium sp. ZY112]|uniref:tRNA pseudouridine(38-40) synthase TruA n=1 Tax=Agaribacterium sp. ZY112 TaxID=3233574 RepID=UPI0035233D6A
MHRIALGLEYLGADFNGFQRQKSTDNTVQTQLEKALSNMAGEPVTTVCAGRTDAGVHATDQVLHFDTLAVRPMVAWVRGVNAQLPDELRVHWAKEVGSDFHARFSAGGRTYRYVAQHGGVKPAVLAKQISHFIYDLDVDAMAMASKCLLGKHDFSSFQASRCQARNPVRTISKLNWYRQGDLWVMEIKADAFLYNMVRNIVGTLVEVGRGVQSIEWMADVLEAKNRCLAGTKAPPYGLYLVDVEYDERFALPKRDTGPAFLALSADNRV